MSNSKVSVIVPVYKGEKYLKECIDSILNQTYSNIEIILVDDESPDLCPKICDEYALKDKRVKIIHKQNGGVSSSRNTGIDSSTGEWIAFIDQDDIYDKNFLKTLYDLCIETGSDISQCDHICFKNEDLKLDDDIERKVKLIDKFEFAKKLWNYHDRPDAIYIWKKLYNRKIFDNARFPDGKRWEDNYFMSLAIDNANRIAYINKPLYYYRIHDGGTVTTSFKRIFLEYFDVMQYTLDYYKEKGYVDLYNCALTYAAKRCRETYFKAKYQLDNSEEDLKYLKSWHDKYYKEIINNHDVPVSDKLYNTIFRCFPLYKIVRKITKEY